MTQQTINLYDGLEALYYFDSDYYDGTANEIKDKSGHGRHAQASGGPTVGVEGPDSFEALSFDGTDDEIDIPTINVDDQNPWTLATLYKVTLDEPQGLYGGGQSFGQETIFIEKSSSKNNLSIRYREITTDDFIFISDFAIKLDVFTPIIIRCDAERNITTNIGVENNTFNTTLNHNALFIPKIGPQPNHVAANNRTSGDMAYFGYWDRKLSDAEAEYLINLTAPRRAQL